VIIKSISWKVVTSISQSRISFYNKATLTAQEQAGLVRLRHRLSSIGCISSSRGRRKASALITAFRQEGAKCPTKQEAKEEAGRRDRLTCKRTFCRLSNNWIFENEPTECQSLHKKSLFVRPKALNQNLPHRSAHKPSRLLPKLTTS